MEATMERQNLRERKLVIYICEVLAQSTLPESVAFADLRAAMLDADAEEAFDEIMTAWGELCLGIVRVTDKIGLAATLFPPKHVDAMNPALNERQARALEIARQTGRVATGDLRDHFDVSGETCRQDLADLCEQGRLEPVGDKRGRVYIIPSAARDGGTLR
jgi:hypothetical protein